MKLSKRQIACLQKAARGYVLRTQFQALPEAEQRAIVEFINEPNSEHPWLTPKGRIALLKATAS